MAKNADQPGRLADQLDKNDLLEMLFDRMPMGIAVLDSSYQIQRYNPTWADFSARYAPSSGTPLVPGVNYFDHLPGTETVVMPLYDRVLGGETIRQEAVRLETGGQITYWDIFLAPISAGNKISGILSVSVDITERMEGQLNLEKRVAERTAELERRQEIAESLRDIIGMINASLPLDVFLNRSVTLAAERLGAAACTLHQFDLKRELLSSTASYGMEGIFQIGGTRRVDDLKPHGADHYWSSTLNHQPTFGNYPPLPERVEEISRDPSIPEDIKRNRIALRQRFAGSFSVPLVVHNQIYGGMVFYYAEPQQFSDDQIQLGLTFAEQVGMAIENAWLHQQDQERQRELQMLLDVASAASSSLNLESLLASALDLLVTQVGAVWAGVSLVDEISGYLGPFLHRPEDPAEPKSPGKLYDAGQTVVKSNKLAYLEPDIEGGFHDHSVLIPIRIRGQTLGLLAIVGVKASDQIPNQLALFNSIADQLGVAIDNARLYQQAEETAVTAERNRLARDLHDAVTQTLFSSSLIADVLPKIWDRDPQEGRRRLEELRQLTKGALSEMRTLLVELRPAALADANLDELIGHLVNAFAAKTRIAVDYSRNNAGNPPPDIKEMVYRIAQEGLNNISKHSGAKMVKLALESSPDAVGLSIKDDGAGFDPARDMKKGLGLGIMAERAASQGADLKIESKIGRGTQVTIIWQAEKAKEQKND